MSRQFRHILIAVLLAIGTQAHAAPQGSLGISVAVDGEGAFWNPTLKSVKIAKVTPDSPAAKAGIVEGDYIVEIEGKAIAGVKANDLKPYMQREVGQTLRLAIKKANGEIKQVSVVPGPKPE